jgi:hypothetical protein
MSELFKMERGGRSLATFSMLAAFGVMLLASGAGYAPSASGASAYPFPSRGGEMPEGSF